MNIIKTFLLSAALSLTLNYTALASNYENNIQATPLYKSLEQARNNEGITGVNKIIQRTAIDAKAVEVISIWARNAYLNKKRNPRYGLMYADSLATIARSLQNKDEKLYKQFMDTGSLMFFSSQLIAREDIARCEDKTARANYIMNWSSDYGRKYYDYVANYNKQQRNEFYNAVISVSNSRDLSHKDLSACASGMKAMSRAIDEGKCDEATGACSGGEEFVTLIPMNAWATERQKVQSNFKDFIDKTK